MTRIFWGFCRNWFLIVPLHYLSSGSYFGFQFADIFIIEKRLPDSPSRGVGESASFLLNIQKPTLRLGESGSRFSVTNIIANSKPKSELLEGQYKITETSFCKNPRKSASLSCAQKSKQPTVRYHKGQTTYFQKITINFFRLHAIGHENRNFAAKPKIINFYLLCFQMDVDINNEMKHSLALWLVSSARNLLHARRC